MSGNWGIEVFLAMSEEQARRKGSVRCMRDEFANSEDIYHKLDEIPEALCVSKVIGWQKEICMTKANFMKLIQSWGMILLPSEASFIQYVQGEYIWLIGFGG